MHVRSLIAPSLAISLAAFAGQVDAGILWGEVVRMDTGAGRIDLDHPVSDPFIDLASIHNPSVGSFVLVESSSPDASAFVSGVEFTSIGGPDAVFSFVDAGWFAPWRPGEHEFAFVASRLYFSSEYGVEVTLLGELVASGTAYGFFEVGGDVEGHVSFGTGSVSYTTTVGPGAQAISWGSIVGEGGGSAEFVGTVTLTLIPGPGSLALFAAAGIVGRARTRR